MRLIVNGEQRDTSAACVHTLLRELDYEGQHFAVAVNYDVVPRAKWAETTLKDGDAVEILAPRQGG